MDTSIPIQVSATCCKSKQILSSPEYLLVLALTDGIALHGRDSEEIHAGTLLFLSPFSERKLWLEPGSRVIYGILPASFLEPLVGIPQRASIVLLQDSADTAREKLIELFDQSYNNPTSALQRLCTAYELLQALEPIITNHVTVQSAPASANQRAAEMIEYLEAHFREPISLGDLAEAFSVSRQYISTVFHRELGVTFSEYLLKLRLEEALRLLLTTNQNVTTISESSGFPNLRSFNLAFQTAHGITPKEFRKKRENAEEETNRKPTGVVLRDINQLLRPYRLVYQKNEAAIRFSDVIEAGRGTSFGQNWNILNVDNSLDCLQRTVQDSLTHIQEEMHFQYIRLGNVTTATMIPFHPSTKKHLFSNFGLLIDFVRGLGLSPMLVMGNNYEVMMDTLVVDKHSYFTSIAHWQDFLKELLDFSIQRWGVEWVSTWRFEFFFPETMYEEQPQEEFLALFEQSLTLIHQLAPDAQVGGPALPVDSVHRPRWKTWFEGLSSRGIKPDFISMEIWADHAWKIEKFRGLYGEMQEFYSIGDMYSADAALAVQKAEEILASMAQSGDMASQAAVGYYVLASAIQEIATVSAGVLVAAVSLQGLVTVAITSSTAVATLGTALMTASGSARSASAGVLSVSGALNGVARSGGAAVGAVRRLAGAARNAAAAIRPIGAAAQQATSAIIRSFSAAAVKAKAAGNAIGKGVLTSIRQGMNPLPKIAAQAMNSLVSAIKSGGSRATASARSAASSIVSALRHAVPGATSAGRYIGMGLANGMASQLGRVRSEAAQLASAAERAIRAKARIHSPSKVSQALGEYWGTGYALGISSMVQSTRKAAERLVTVPTLAAGPDLSYHGSLEQDFDYYRNAQYTIQVPVTVDGREFARATATYTQEELNKRQTRDSRKRGIL